MATNRIENAWADFREDGLSPDTPEELRRIVRAAYFAGAVAALEQFKFDAFTGQGHRVLQELVHEMSQFRGELDERGGR